MSALAIGKRGKPAPAPPGEVVGPARQTGRSLGWRLVRLLASTCALLPGLSGLADPPAEKPRTGNFELDLKKHRTYFHAYVPDKYTPAKKYGLILTIGEAAQTPKMYVDSWKYTCDQRDFIAAAAKAPHAEWGADDDLVLDVLAELEKTYHLDLKRSVLQIYQSNSTFGYDFAFKHAGRFGALIGFQSKAASGIPRNLRGYPVYIFHGEKNKYASVGPVRNMAENMKKKGLDVTYDEKKDWDENWPNDAIPKMETWLTNVFTAKAKARIEEGKQLLAAKRNGPALQAFEDAIDLGLVGGVGSEARSERAKILDLAEPRFQEALEAAKGVDKKKAFSLLARLEAEFRGSSLAKRAIEEAERLSREK